MARRAAELQGQKRHSEAHAVVRELADVVGQWEGRLRAFRAFRATEEPTRAPQEAVYVDPRLPVPDRVERRDKNKAQGLGVVLVPDGVEQRLGRLEQQIGEILKRLDQRSDGK